jgi:hypothetical protein
MPTPVPSTLPRTTPRQYFLRMPPTPLNTRNRFSSFGGSRFSVDTTLRRISETANMPIIAGMKATPPSRSGMPNV